MVAPPRPSSPSRRTVMRRTEPAPPPAPRTTEEAMRGTDPRSGFSRSDVDLAQRRGGDLLLAPLSTLTDEAKQTGALERGTPLSYGLTAASFLGDLFNPSVDIPVAAGIRGVGQGINAAKTYRGMSPENRALYNAMLRGLHHGDRTTGAGRAEPFTAVNRGADSWSRNWFGGDLFGVRSPRVAEGYARSNAGSASRDEYGKLLPGFSAEGFPTTRGARFRLSEPMEAVANRRILDLTGRTLDEADPALYKRLSEQFADEIASEGVDIAKMDLTGLGGLHQSRYSDLLRPVLEEFGYDTVRHLSGQLQGDIVSPVYAFLRPEGIRATPMLPSPKRVGDVLDAQLSSGAQRINQAVDPTVQAVKGAPKTFADTLASTLWRNDRSQMPAPIRRFVDERTRPLPFGEGFQDTIPHSVDPRLGAFFRRLGLDKIWKEAPPEPSTRVGGAF